MAQVNTVKQMEDKEEKEVAAADCVIVDKEAVSILFILILFLLYYLFIYLFIYLFTENSSKFF